MTTSREDLDHDVSVWGLEGNGQFFILSAYLASELEEDIKERKWRMVWRWVGPNKIKYLVVGVSQSITH